MRRPTNELETELHATTFSSRFHPISTIFLPSPFNLSPLRRPSLYPPIPLQLQILTFVFRQHILVKFMIIERHEITSSNEVTQLKNIANMGPSISQFLSPCINKSPSTVSVCSCDLYSIMWPAAEKAVSMPKPTL